MKKEKIRKWLTKVGILFLFLVAGAHIPVFSQMYEGISLSNQTFRDENLFQSQDGVGKEHVYEPFFNGNSPVLRAEPGGEYGGDDSLGNGVPIEDSPEVWLVISLNILLYVIWRRKRVNKKNIE